MASTGKKGKKKGVTVAWNEFVADAEKNSSTTTTRLVTRKTGSWADELEDDDPSHKEKVVLPSGPRATWGTDIDDNKVPKFPPFLAYISNLPYEVEEEEIEEFFKDMKIVEVRLPRDERPGKLRGFGYVQFETRGDLIDALSMPDTSIKGRRIRIDVAAESDRRRGRDSMRSDRPQYDPDRSAGDWRSGPREGPLGEQERGGGRGRDSGFITRDRDGGSGFITRDRDGSSGFITRDRDGSSGFMTRDRDGPIFDRSAPRREFGSGGFREGFDRDRDRGGGFRDGGDREKSWFSDRDDRDRGRFGDREGGGSGGGGFADRDRGRFGDRDRDFGRDRDREGGFGPRREYGREGFRSEGRDDLPPVDRGEARMRPKLNLQPRTKPVEETVAPPPVAPSAPAPSAPAPTGAPASIFGGAKPVDTAAREREIEERLARERGGDDARPRDRDGSRGPPRRTEAREGGQSRENFWSQRSRQNGPPSDGRVTPQSDHSDEEVRGDRSDSQRRYRDRPESPEGRDGSSDGQYGGRSESSEPRRDFESDNLDSRGERGRVERGRTGPPDVRGSSSSSSGAERGRPPSREERPKSARPEGDSKEEEDEIRMPKYHEEEPPNFAGSNKFANLHSDDEEHDD